MKNTAAIHTTAQRKAREASRKAVALFMSILLAIMCLPILPGNVEEAHAETAVTTGTATDANTLLYTSSYEDANVGVYFRINYDYRIENVAGIWDQSYNVGWINGNHNVSSYGNQHGVSTSYLPIPAFGTYTLKSAVPLTFGGPSGITWPAGSLFKVTFAQHDYTEYGCRYDVATITWKDPAGATIAVYDSFNPAGATYSIEMRPDFASTYTYSKRVSYNPIVLNEDGNEGVDINGYKGVQNPAGASNYENVAPRLTKQIGDSVSSTTWIEGITAKWGKTGANTIPTMGSISDDSLVGGTDPDISTSGTSFDKVGLKNHLYTVKDTHSLSAGFPDDTTSAITNRLIVVQAASEPTFDIVYAAGALDRDGVSIAGNAYNGEWTNQPLEMDASHTDPGTYETVIRKYDDPTPATTFTNAAVDTTNAHSVNIPSYQTQSADTTGNDFTSILRAEDPLNLGTYIDLSPESAKQNVKIDTTNPVPAATYAALTGFTDTSTDTLSGIDTARQKIAVVATGDPAPANSDYTSFSSLSVTTPGYYDVYVWAWDNAGNNAQSKVLTNVLIASTQSPTIAGELASGPNSGDALASGTWTNKDVKVTVTPPSPEIGGNYYSSLYDASGPTQEAKASVIQTSVDKTFTAETTGTTLYGVLVDASDVALSAMSSNYVVKIDKTNPTPGLTFNAGVPDYGFTDTSTDTLSPVGANSGIDTAPATTKTLIAIVDAGDPQPATSEYVTITGTELPATGWYDVWMIVTDIAGNEAAPTKVLDHISRSGLDEITAKDFAYDIASGAASFDDAMAKLLSHVVGTPYGSNTDFASSVLLVDATELANIQGAIAAGLKGTTWPLTFSTPVSATQASTTINVTLFDNGPTPTPLPPGPLTQEVIYGNDFNWGISSGHVSDNDARLSSFVTAYDVNGDAIAQTSLDVDQTQLGAINAAIDAGQKDTTWPLTFSTPDGTTTTVNVTLFDNGNPPAAGAEAIVANDFNWGISTGALTNPEAYHLSSVDATSATGAAMAQTSVIIDSAELAAINAAVAAGLKGTSWPLTFTTDGSTGTAASTTVTVTLYDAGPAGPIASGAEHVVGNNFNWGISTGSLDDVTSLIRSNAQATKGDGHTMDVATNVTVSASDLAAINAAIAAGQKGTTWPLTLTTNGNHGTPASATVYVTLYDNGPAGPIPAGSEHVVANDFNWGISTGAMNGNDIANLSLLAATDANGVPMALSSINMNPTELAAINDAIAAGQKDTSWPLTFTTNGSTGTAASTTITVTLFDNGPTGPIPAGSEHIVGNNFNWGITSGAISDTHAYHLGRITPAGAFGATLTQANVSIDAAELAALNAAIAADQQGTTWPLTFTTDGSTGTPASVTINVTLYHEGPGTVTPGDPHIVANHFSHEIHKGAISDNDAKDFSLVAALAADASAGDISHITPDATHMAAINAAIAAGDTTTPSWPLDFTYTCPQSGKSVSASIKVTLLGASDLEVTKSVDNANPLPGDTITYTIKVKNKGVATASGIWVKDNVPANTTFVSCDVNGVYGATLDGQEYVHWYFASLGSGAEVTLTMKVKVDECPAGTVIENVALYEEGKTGLPANLDDDPKGGKTNPATSTVADAGSKTKGETPQPRGKKTLKTGDDISGVFVTSTLGLIALVLLVVALRKRSKQQ